MLDNSEIGAVDHLSLNQSRMEDITLKEDFGNDFLNLVDFGRTSFCSPSACTSLFYISFPFVIDIFVKHTFVEHDI